MAHQELENIHDGLATMWARGIFEPTIHYIRFPVFKNLVTNMRIDFSHPITAIVGPNGCNKTAILRAVQGCPTGNDLGNYWFGTAMDSIPADARHRFIYGRYSDPIQRTVEVIKTRIGRKRSSRSKKEIDPDLFEPSRPLTRAPDNMEAYPFQDAPPIDGSRTRWNTIDKQVLYLDFRSQLSAFDWAFYHSESNWAGALPLLQGLRMRKSMIRNRSKRLAAAIDDGRRSDKWYGTERIIEPIHSTSDEERGEVQKILGRQYGSIRMINHRYFGRQGGWTVLMQSSDIRYSEAFAGSGEYAAVSLVHSIMTARPKSLILLDEPEVSLHPAAQRAVMDFLARAVLQNKHQIVFATHSPEMLRRLPINAIKVLSIRADNYKVDIPSQEASAHAAFEAVGASYDHPTVVVEDRLAAAIVRNAIKDRPISPLVTIKFIPGGASSLWSHYLPMWAHDDRRNLLLLLDGDQITEDPPSPSKVAPDDLEQVVLDSLKGNKPKLPFGASEEPSASRRAESLVIVLNWRRSFVDFLPFETPEAYLLAARAARVGVTLTEQQALSPKAAWEWIARDELGREVTADDIFLVQEMEVNKLSPNEKDMRQILTSINRFVNESSHDARPG